MDSLKSLFSRIDLLRSELERFNPLKEEDEERLWRKFRLEWNYNSNHIEGNTLTLGQTELLIIFGKTTGDHEIREYEEMTGHDVAVKLIREYAADNSRQLTESDIRDLNKRLLVKPYYRTAQTTDGQSTRKLIQPGVYKSEPNSVILQNGEMFYYVSPEDVPIRMNELINWYRESGTTKPLHPLLIASMMHYDFVRIHPFDDGNGRTARLLMNYVLLKNGYPPVIVKSSDKKNYLDALNKADVGFLNDFVEYIGEQLIWSLNVNIKAAKGLSIEDDDDIDKEIEILWKENKESLENSKPKSIEILFELLNKGMTPLIESLVSKHQKLNDFFLTNQFNVFTDSLGNVIKNTDDAYNILATSLAKYDERISKSRLDFASTFNEWSLSIYHGNLKTNPDKNLQITANIKFSFYPLRYEIFYGDRVVFKKNYSYLLTNEDVSYIVNLSVRSTIDLIRANRTTE